MHFSCQAVPQASVHLLQLLLQHPLTQEGFCTPCTAAEIANNNNNNIIIARFRELRLGENITSCTIKPRQPATPWEQRHPQYQRLLNASVLTDPFFQGRDWCGSRLGSLRWAFLQRAALIVHPVALELAQQVKEAFLVRRGPVDLLERQRNAAESERPKYCPMCDGSAWCGRGGVAVAVPCPVLCLEPAPGCARSLPGSLLLGPTVPSALEQPLSFPLFSPLCGLGNPKPPSETRPQAEHLRPARGERGTHGEPQPPRATSTATAPTVKCRRVPSPASLSTPLNLTF